MPTAQPGRPDRSAGSGRSRRRATPAADELAGGEAADGRTDDLLDDSDADTTVGSMVGSTVGSTVDSSVDDADDELDSDLDSDDDADDDSDDDADDADAGDEADDSGLHDEVDEDDDSELTTGGGTATKTRRAGSVTTTSLDKKTGARTGGRKPGGSSRPAKSRRPRDQRTGNPFVALIRFVREVVGEMRKVLWPTRRELVVYTIAVIIFVTVMISIVGGLDFGFARLVLFVFG